MKKYVFLLVSIVNLIIAFTSESAALEGACKGLAGVFFILFLIYTLMGNQPIDKTSH